MFLRQLAGDAAFILAFIILAYSTNLSVFGITSFTASSLQNPSAQSVNRGNFSPFKIFIPTIFSIARIQPKELPMTIFKNPNSSPPNHSPPLLQILNASSTYLIQRPYSLQPPTGLLPLQFKSPLAADTTETPSYVIHEKHKQTRRQSKL